MSRSFPHRSLPHRTLVSLIEYDALAGKRLAKRTMSIGQTEAIEYAPDGTHLAVPRGGYLHLFRAGMNLEEEHQWPGLWLSVPDRLQWSSDSRMLLVPSDRLAKIVDTSTGRLMYLTPYEIGNSAIHLGFPVITGSNGFSSRAYSFSDARISRDGRYVLLLTEENLEFKIFDLARAISVLGARSGGASEQQIEETSVVASKVALRPEFANQLIWAIDFAGVGPVLACTGFELHSFDPWNPSVRTRYPIPCAKVHIAPGGRTAILHGTSNLAITSVLRLDLQTGQSASLIDNYQTVSSLAISWDASMLGVLDRQGNVSVIRTADGHVLHRFHL